MSSHDRVTRADLHPDRWAWLDNPPAASLSVAGALTLGLLTHSHRWINRRVERISFREAHSAHHQVLLDLWLPANLPPVARLRGENIYMAPLFFFARDPEQSSSGTSYHPLALNSTVDLFDSSGNQLPRVTGRTSARIASVALATQARSVLDRDQMDDELVELITRVSMGDTNTRDTALRDIFETGHDHNGARDELRGDAIFKELAYALADHTIVFTVFTGHEPPSRAVITLSYEEELRILHQAWHKELRRGLGWKSKVCQVRLNEIGAAATYHVEIEVPRELELTAIGLFGERYQIFRGGRAPQGWRQRITSRVHGQSPTPPDDEVSPAPRRDPEGFYIEQVGRTGAGHIYIPRPDGRRVGYAWVKLRVRRQGFLVAALFASVMIFLTLLFYSHKAGAIARAGVSDATVAGLLLIPTFLAAYIASPVKHDITARTLRWARLALFLNGLLPFIAAAGLITTNTQDSDHHAAAVNAAAHLKATWDWLPPVGAVFVVLFIVSLLFPRVNGDSRYAVRHRE